MRIRQSQLEVSAYKMAKLEVFEFTQRYKIDKTNDYFPFNVYNYGNDNNENYMIGRLNLFSSDYCEYGTDGGVGLKLIAVPSPPKNISYDLKVLKLGDLNPDNRNVSHIEEKIDDLCWINGEFTMEQIEFREKCDDIEVQLKITYSPPVIGPVVGPSFAQRCEAMLNDKDTSDVTIICEEERLTCHKFVLCSTSDVFKRAL